MLYRLIADSRPLTEPDLHALHAAIQTSVEVDYLKPVGAWKVEPNYTLAKQEGRTVINDTYAAPEQVPALMREWFKGFAMRRDDPSVPALDAYAWSHATLVRIHPYADGNGRRARLVANVPVIEKGCLPILVPAGQRLEYIECLASWQMASGALRAGTALEGNRDRLAQFHERCAGWMKSSSSLLDEVEQAQRLRRCAITPA